MSKLSKTERDKELCADYEQDHNKMNDYDLEEEEKDEISDRYQIIRQYYAASFRNFLPS